MTRHALILSLAIGGAILLGGWLYLSGVGGLPQSTGESAVAFSELAQGQNSGAITERKNYRIMSADELSALYELMYPSGAPPLPPIDFSKSEVLAVFDGTHTTGGYTIAISSITDAGGKRLIALTHAAPDATCATTQTITSPFVLAVVPKSTLPLSHTDTDTVRACQ